MNFDPANVRVGQLTADDQMGQGIAAADWPVIETAPPSGFTRHEVDHCGAIVESAESARV